MTDQAIELVDHDTAWADRFAEQQARLAVIIAPWLAGMIEHIGSTAVPGLRAKPIIDVLAPVRSLAEAQDAVPALARDGWLFWPTDPNRHYRLWFLRPSPDARTHHLQVIQHDDPAFRALVAFRDALRADAGLRSAYASLKSDLAETFRDDRDAYTNAKAEFVQAALQSAYPVARKML